MKKIILYSLCLVFIFSLGSCASTKNMSSQTTTKKTQKASNIEETILNQLSNLLDFVPALMRSDKSAENELATLNEASRQVYIDYADVVYDELIPAFADSTKYDLTSERTFSLPINQVGSNELENCILALAKKSGNDASKKAMQTFFSKKKSAISKHEAKKEFGISFSEGMMNIFSILESEIIKMKKAQVGEGSYEGNLCTNCTDKVGLKLVKKPSYPTNIQQSRAPKTSTETIRLTEGEVLMKKGDYKEALYWAISNNDECLVADACKELLKISESKEEKKQLEIRIRRAEENCR